jgi:hypothetical protein
MLTGAGVSDHYKANSGHETTPHGFYNQRVMRGGKTTHHLLPATLRISLEPIAV